MFQTKQYYRELDRLLDQRSPTRDDWFSWLLREFLDRFGADLRLENGRLYEEEEGGFRLVAEVRSRDPEAVGMVLPDDYPPIRRVLTHGVYLFHEEIGDQAPAVESRLGGLRSAALLLEGESRRILAFGLGDGWNRDDVDFALHTLRHAVELRRDLAGMRSDLEQAAEIQRSLLPRELPRFEGFTLAARSVPAATVGGDFYDVTPLGDDTLVIGVGDASGHGLGAALLARDVVTGIRMGAERELKITETVTKLNRVIHRSALSSRFVSLFYAELERNGNLFYVNAGHPAPWIVGSWGSRRLAEGGSILGPVAEAEFERGFARLEPGDRLVVVTDGFTERPDPAGRHLGEEGVERALAATPGADAEGVLEALFTTATDHGGGRPRIDDTTALVVARDPA